MPTAYDQVLYLSLPFDRSHPDQMAVMATLFGLEPAPPRSCRVLEIACADGGNIIPMACELPNSSFVGFDLAGEVIENGRKQIADLGLTNIHLHQKDLMDAGPDLGTFDYIIAHGLYSWIPEPVRDKLMSTVKTLLAPNGVAYISYNALPGCRIREMFREMLLFHLRGISEPQQRIDRAREFLNCFVQSQEKTGDMGNFLKIEAEFLLEQGPVVLFHDELADVYHPVYVSDFVAHARRYGLQFVSEASFTEMQPRKYPPEVIERAQGWAGGDRILRELYFDFLRGRTFRRTLLCHDNLSVAEELRIDRIPLLHAASPATAVSESPSVALGVAEEFRASRGASAKTAHPLAKAALILLTRAWPESLSFDFLLSSAAQLTGEPPDPEGLARILSGTFAAGLVDLHAIPPRSISQPGRFPCTTPLVRWQAQKGARITTLRHTTIEAEGGVERRLLELLDGTRDLAALTEELAPLLTDSREEVARRIQDNLAKLARFGLLVS